MVLGGAEMLLSEKAPLPVIVHIGLQGLAGYLIPALMVLCGLLLLFHPVQQTFYSLLAILLALGSWITSNLGGFLVGMLLGVVGGALAFAWQRDGKRGAGRRHRLRPRGEPSAGLSVIFRESPPEPGSRGRGEPGRGAGAWGITAIIVMALASTLPRGQAPAFSPVGTQDPAASPQPTASRCAQPSPCPSGTPSPTPSPGPSESPSPTPSESPSPTPSTGPSESPSPAPSHRHTRQVPAAGAPSTRAAAGETTLTAGRAVLKGLSFAGIARLPTTAGTLPVLKLSMNSLTLTGGTVLRFTEDGLAFTDRSTLLAFRGHVVLYTTKISGDLHGTHITFAPQRPPPARLAQMTLVNVVAKQPYTTADSLDASGVTEESPG